MMFMTHFYLHFEHCLVLSRFISLVSEAELQTHYGDRPFKASFTTTESIHSWGRVSPALPADVWSDVIGRCVSLAVVGQGC